MMDVDDANDDENFCVLLHNQRVIRFCCMEGQFWLDRTEKCEMVVNGGKFKIEKIQCDVVKDLNLGIRMPVVTMNITSKKNSYFYAFMLDYTRKKGSQLRNFDHFPLPSAVDANLIVRDGPSFVFLDENRLKLVYYCSAEYKTNVILPVCVGNFVFLNENDRNLYFIDGKNGFLTSFCPENEELVTHGALFDDFTRKYAGKIDGVHVELDLNDLTQSVVYICCHSELEKFQDGRLIQNMFFPLSGKIVDICSFKRFSGAFLMILCSDGTLSAVNDENFELVNRWSDVERFGVDDVMATGNKCVFIGFKSLVALFLYNLNEKSIVTDVVDVFYPKGENARKSDGKLCSAAAAIENKLRLGEFMLEEAKSRLSEKEECVGRGMARLQELSASGVVGSDVFNPHIINIISPANPPVQTTHKTSTSPLKILELNEKIHKQFWLIRLKLQNQSNKTLGNFTLHLLSDNPVQFTVKFYREGSDVIPATDDLGLANVLEFKNYFSPQSPSIKNQETIELIAVVHLTQPIFEKLTVAVQISTIFTEINEENQREQPRQQICGSVTHRFDDVIPPTQHFDIWALSTTERSITLEIHSTETNLTTIRQLLTENLNLQHNENIFYFQNVNHPLAAIAIQIASKMAARATRIRVHYTAETELIHLLHLIYAKLPHDLILTPSTGDLQALTNILNANLHEEIEIIREIISNQAKSTQIPTIFDEKSLENIRAAFTARQKLLQDARSGKIDYKTYKNLKNRLENVELQTDVHIGLFSHMNVQYYK